MLFGLTDTRPGGDQAAGKDNVDFTCYCDASLVCNAGLLGRGRGQQTDAELVDTLGRISLFNFMYPGQRFHP